MDHQDLLSDVFSTLRLESRLYFETDLRGDFSVRVPSERRLIRFHLVREGACHVTVPGRDPVELRGNDLAIVPNGVEQILSRRPGDRAVSLTELIGGGAVMDGVLRHGDGGGTVRLLCGFCSFDEEIEHPVIANLPDLVVVRPSELGAESSAAAAIGLLSLESGLKHQGMMAILSRLLEVVFIQTVRRMTSPRGDGPDGFVAALADRHLSRALHAIHREPQKSWTVSDLARVAGMSRGRFAGKFAKMVGSPPIDYLTSWRLIKARALLQTSELAMADIAERCGYRSVPSFTRRFKARFGVGPGMFRRSTRRR